METLKLTRNENTPWGFRLSGGKDFGVILTVQKVNPGSIADKAGMKAGDAVTEINGQETESLRHKDAQDAIIRGGNCLQIAVQRGGATNWKPTGKEGVPRAPAAGENVTAIVHQQYNSPAAMYSMNVIAETLSAHAEMIAPGVMGINFMKPEKPINTMSEVYKLVQEEEQMKGDRTPSPAPSPHQPFYRSLKIAQAKSPTPPATTPPVRQIRVSAPVTPVKTPPPIPPKPVAAPPSAAPTTPPITGPQAMCSDCGRFIPGVFVRLNDRTLHEECFRCSTCGTSLKNMGYININNKLYCEVHAKLAAKLIAPEEETSPPPMNAAPMVPPPMAPAPMAPPPMAPAPMAPPPMAPPSPMAPPPPAPAPPSAPEPAPAPAPAPTPSAPAPPKITQSTLTPFSPQVQQNLGNLPQSPSSSGGLPFRSISPQPFRRAPGDYHKVLAPMSPTTTGGTMAPIFQQSGPLPFEMTPYMPPEPASSLFSSSSQQVTQVSQMSQTTQQTTQISQQSSQSSQFSVDYKQVIAQQSGRVGTKFVWPPPKTGNEPAAPVLESNATPMPPTYRPPPNTQHINYSPLVMQSAPSSISQSPSFRSIQPLVPAMSAPAPAPPAPAQAPPPFVPPPFVPPPLPSSFMKIAEQEAHKPAPPAAPEFEKTEAPKPAPSVFQPPPLPTSAPSGPAAPGFAPVLPPVVEPTTEPKPSAPQSGVQTGAGSRPAPKRGRGQLKEQTPGCRIPICAVCGAPIRGPFVTALGKTWCPDHFHCNNLHCKSALQDIGFVEEQGQLYCENCYEAFLAPICNKCTSRIKGDCLNALDRQWHPQCFICAYCSKAFGNTSFYLEDGLPYCEKDWNELFTTKCVGCGFAIEAGDRWVEALNNNYHSQCFKCSICNKNLEGQSFYAKGGRPFCKAHAR